MKSYLYYPGCSLTGTAKEYDFSVRALMDGLGAQLVEIEDWTCCGATAAQAVDTDIALALAARNLALAGKTGENQDILVPCSACYLNLKAARETLASDKEKRKLIGHALSREDLNGEVPVAVRHLLDVLSRDVDWVPGMFSKSMEGMVVAPYYGCQCLRPYQVFDNPERPRSMDAMIQAAGARVLDWEMGGQCCGASNATTKPEAGRFLVGNILDAARGADCIVTVCPMCQMNLETCGGTRDIPVLYLPQFLGRAMGLSREVLGLDLNLSDNRALTL
ncbi:MAG: disulfide reductase [Desulfobacter sp.]|nr:MAG: disulfide reductase [Desulfobacter sp.]